MIARRSFIKFIASAVVAKSLLSKVVEAAAETGTQLMHNCELVVGDVFTITGCESVSGALQTFRVTHISSPTAAMVVPVQ